MEDRTIGVSALSSHAARVSAFMQKASQDTPATPTLPSDEVRLLRAMLLLEETLETIQKGYRVNVSVRYSGVGAGGSVPIQSSMVQFELKPGPANLIEIADGHADVSVVNVGGLLACGIEDMPVLYLVDESNLAKFRGDAHRDPSGKWIKPSDWTAPDLEAELRRQGAVGPLH